MSYCKITVHSILGVLILGSSWLVPASDRPDYRDLSPREMGRNTTATFLIDISNASQASDSEGNTPKFYETAVSALNAARYWNLDLEKEYSQSFDRLRRYINAQSVKLKEGRSPLLNLPPFDALYVITENSIKQLRDSLGRDYSLIKHGDEASLRLYADSIATRIKDRFTREGLNAEEWAIAGTGYFRVPNTAAHHR